MLFPWVLAHPDFSTNLEEKLASQGLPCQALGYLGERMNVSYSIKTGREAQASLGLTDLVLVLVQLCDCPSHLERPALDSEITKLCAI